MGNRTYFHTEVEREANREDLSERLLVNCTGMVNSTSFVNRSVRRDYYYIYVTRGNLILNLNQSEENQVITLEPGDVIVIEPGRPYQYHNQGETSYLWVHFTGYEAEQLNRELCEMQRNQAICTKIHIGIHSELQYCFERMFQEFIINDQAAGEITVCLLREILALTKRYSNRKAQKMPLTSLEYIHRHFREELDVDELAEMEHISPTTFRILFKKHTGSAPTEYIIAQRISESCRLLTETDESVRDIAAKVGYGDAYYFSRIFRKKMGISPLKYRAENNLRRNCNES